jgi:hypothetical protein
MQYTATLCDFFIYFNKKYLLKEQNGLGDSRIYIKLKTLLIFY